VATLETLGIIAGNGVYPRLLADAARRGGVKRIVAAAFTNETDDRLVPMVDQVDDGLHQVGFFSDRRCHTFLSPRSAEALGVDSTKYKLLVHALSAALVAVAGGLFAINFQYISPGSVFDFRLSLTIVLMPIVGGLGTVAGPVLGALLFGYLQIKLLSSSGLRDSYLFIYGAMLIAVMLFEPKGLVGLLRRLRQALPRPSKRLPDAG
jgi:MFS family permease